MQSQRRMTAYLLAVTFVTALLVTQVRATKVNLYLNSFAVGDCAEVYYTAPTTRATINLMSKKNDIVLHCDYRVKYSSQRNTVILNTKLAGKPWNPKTRELVTGVKTTPGTVLEFALCPRAASEISVALNGKPLANYTNKQIDIATVSQVMFNSYKGNAKLEEMCVTYT